MKEYLLLILLILSNFACTNKYNFKKDTTWPKDTLKQKILLNYIINNDSSSIIIYSLISESKKIAQLEGFKYNLHLFTLKINNNYYSLDMHTDKTKKDGLLEDFIFFDFNFDLFKTLKKSNQQPIVFNNDKNVTLSIRIIEETPL